MRKIMVVFGTRPEAIKMCPLVRAMKKTGEYDVLTVVTGQHTSLLEGAMCAFEVVADVSLDVMKESQTLSYLTGELIPRLDAIIRAHRPEAVVVHGDTCTAFAASLSAFYLCVPVLHVEAGLRTYDLRSPFPEELFRRVISLIADAHFAPTERARANLIAEGVDGERIFVVGNTAIDALAYTVHKDHKSPLLEWGGEGRLILMTAHRRENIGAPMEEVFRAVRRVCEEREDVRVLYPVHPNPRVREIAARILGGCERIRLVSPLPPEELHNILARAYMVITDSGGIQEEACALGVPALVARDTTERPEGAEAGGTRLVGTEQERVRGEILRLLDDADVYQKMCFSASPYGDGTACDQICQILREKLALFTEL